MPTVETTPVSLYTIANHLTWGVVVDGVLYPNPASVVGTDVPALARVRHVPVDNASVEHVRDEGVAQVFVGDHGETAILLPPTSRGPKILAGVGRWNMFWHDDLSAAMQTVGRDLNQMVGVPVGQAPPPSKREALSSAMRAVITDRPDRAALLGT